MNLPSDCGNAPRIGVVAEFVRSWASGDAEAVAAALTEDATWAMAGGSVLQGDAAAAKSGPGLVPRWVDVASIITHGRLASCDGFLSDGSVTVAFSHVFHFASTSKTARIKHVRSYLVPE